MVSVGEEGEEQPRHRGDPHVPAHSDHRVDSLAAYTSLTEDLPNASSKHAQRKEEERLELLTTHHHVALPSVTGELDVHRVLDGEGDLGLLALGEQDGCVGHVLEESGAGEALVLQHDVFEEETVDLLA